jgi:hypothetical protein
MRADISDGAVEEKFGVKYTESYMGSGVHSAPSEVVFGHHRREPIPEEIAIEEWYWNLHHGKEASK